ncbi:RSP_2648 family PIN domain-containing protein [Pseudotabrizicola algicola]|uniref:PIN domain-containing protein n=1 Tax=Pseudotabrizicola algicola TaxID=2709381 RepID=A0A6B3RMB5_9RHOB|nr:PIN domain-containing protein [Pseudotabrizicola algicola]NEX47190.1 PIN domain-containing protein [Pseudotabrizicola algicola]
MRLVLDACVLYPTVLREILLGCARAGLYEPLVSERILREWVRATAKLGAAQQAAAEGEAALLRAGFPAAMVRARPEIEARLALPDPDDVHVLAVAIGGHADAILTFNAADFPQHLLAEEGIVRRDPDGFLWELWSHEPQAVEAVVAAVLAKASALSGQAFGRKALLRRVRLNRLARAMDSAGQ